MVRAVPKGQVTPERVIEKKFVERVKLLGGLCEKFTSPSNRGVPDRICIMPNGVLVFAEMKSTVGKLSPLQMLKKEQYEKLGHRYVIISSVEDINAFGC
jgi:hypothetical protein